MKFFHLQQQSSKTTGLQRLTQSQAQYIRPGRCSARPSKANGRQSDPDFDSLQLDDAYYKMIGLSQEEAAEQLDEIVNLDPMNDADLDDDSESDEEDQVEKDGIWTDPIRTSKSQKRQAPGPPLFGPPAAVLAGFRENEIAMVRASMDEAGAYELKVIPCTPAALHGTVENAIHLPEPEWEKPKPSREHMGSANWGSVRTILFSGLSEEDVLMCLTLLEYAGLPPICVCSASPENSQQVVGELLAKTVKEQKQKKASRVTQPEFHQHLEEDSVANGAAPTISTWESPKRSTQARQQAPVGSAAGQAIEEVIEDDSTPVIHERAEALERVSISQPAASIETLNPLLRPVESASEGQQAINLPASPASEEIKAVPEPTSSQSTQLASRVSDSSISMPMNRGHDKEDPSVDSSRPESYVERVKPPSLEMQGPGIGSTSLPAAIPRENNKEYLGMSLGERLKAQAEKRSRAKNGRIQSSQLRTQSASRSQNGASKPETVAFGQRPSPQASSTSRQSRFQSPSLKPTQEAQSASLPVATNSAAEPEPAPRIGRWQSTGSLNQRDAPADATKRGPPPMPPSSPIGFSPNIRSWTQAESSRPQPPGAAVQAQNPKHPLNGSRRQDFAEVNRARSSSSIEAKLDTARGEGFQQMDIGPSRSDPEGAQSPVSSSGNESGGFKDELDGELPSDSAIFGSTIQTHEAAEEDRRLRREAAAEMQRRARLAQSQGDETAYQEAVNMIDAVAAGEDLDTMLKFSGAKKEGSVKEAVEMHAEENKRKMEAVLNQLRAGAASLPEDERKKLDQQVKVLESDKENISKVLSQLGAGLDSVPSDDRAELQSQLKREAWDPTRDAIGAALACGITAEELRQMVMQAVADKNANRGEWYPSVAQASKTDLEQFR